MSENYFDIGSLSWKEVAEQMQKSAGQMENDGLSKLAQRVEHGQLALDIYQTNADVIVEAPIAGVAPEDLDISIHHDVLTIKGERKRGRQIKDNEVIYQEVHWGTFSRSIILPVEVIADRIEATLTDGVLTVRLPKARTDKAVKVTVKR